MTTPFYDPAKSYEENFNQGPFGAFADGQVYKNKNKPEYKFLGLKLFSPFGIPAGPLLNGKYVKAALDKGFDIAVYKTVRTHKYPCAPWPNVLSVQVKDQLSPDVAQKGVIANRNYNSGHLSITNSFGVPSFDPDFWQADLRDTVSYAPDGQLVIGSFQGTLNPEGDKEKYIKDFVLAAKLVKETGVKVLEVNLSCPNEGTSHLLCFDVDSTKNIVEAIKNEIGNSPLIIKISYYQDKALLKHLIEEVGAIVDGISAINTIPAKILDDKGNQALPGKGRLISGVCGHAIKWAGLELVNTLTKLRSDLNFKYTIMGVGGVTRKEDFVEYKKAGADAVMSATGAMWNPYLAQEIKESNI